MMWQLLVECWVSWMTFDIPSSLYSWLWPPQYVPSLQLFFFFFFALICGLAVWGGEQNATLAVFMYKTVFLIYNKVLNICNPLHLGILFSITLFLVVGCWWCCVSVARFTSCSLDNLVWCGEKGEETQKCVWWDTDGKDDGFSFCPLLHCHGF